ncbi:MAG: tyrosine-type recombinase/integrase [Roseiarcus sp.]
MPLKISRRHGTLVWYIRGTVRGVTVDESTKVTDKEQAEAIRAKREWEIITRQIGGAKSVATFLEAAVSYMENGGEARYLKPLIDHFKSTPLSEIGQAEVEACARKLLPGRSPGTVNRKVFTPISAVMTHAAKRKLCDRPMFDRPKQPRGRVRWITPEEADRLIACCAPHLAPIVTFMFFTGCRVGEAMALDWRDVDLKRAHAVFLETKNGDRRGTPLHPRAIAALSSLPHRSGPVFRRSNNEPYVIDDGMSGRINEQLNAACRLAGIENFHPHDCRHTWATWHYAANRDLAALMTLGGWRTVTMVLRYAHVNVSNLAPGVLKLGVVA